MWSDKKTFCLDGPNGVSYYWQHIGQEEDLMTRHQNGGGSIIIWVEFSEKEKTNIAFLSRNQNSSKDVNTSSFAITK